MTQAPNNKPRCCGQTILSVIPDLYKVSFSPPSYMVAMFLSCFSAFHFVYFYQYNLGMIYMTDV